MKILQFHTFELVKFIKTSSLLFELYISKDIKKAIIKAGLPVPAVF